MNRIDFLRHHVRFIMGTVGLGSTAGFKLEKELPGDLIELFDSAFNLRVCAHSPNPDTIKDALERLDRSLKRLTDDIV